MREFNTSGPCDPALHYMVVRETLLANGMEKVEKGRYLTLFAPGQAGKTTFFKLLLNRLQQDFTTVWVSFKNLNTASKQEFYQGLNHELQSAFKKYAAQTDVSIDSPITLGHFFEKQQAKPIVLAIDDFEGIPGYVIGEVMHTFRKIYHQKEYYCLHSLILAGVSTVIELVASQAAAFNVTEDFQVPYFSHAEVSALIQQYVTESGQAFETDVINAIYANTRGQPGLVCALCACIVEQSTRSQPVTMEDYYKAQHHFLTEGFDKNIINIVQKVREKRNLMLKLIFGAEAVAFTLDNPDIVWLYANGMIDKSDGYVAVPVPLYAKCLINAFRPSLNGETGHYTASSAETLNQYLSAAGELNLNALLDAYRAYIRRRGFRAFDTENLKEAAQHYSLDGFIHFFIQCLEGHSFVEVPSSRGQTDILILHRKQKYIIETKRFVNHYYFKKGKGQLAEYLRSEALDSGWYVVFSHLHTDKHELFSEEQIQGRRIYTHIIPTEFEQPSRLPVPDELKLTDAEKIALNLLTAGGLTSTQIAQATGVSLERLEQLSADNTGE